MVAKIRKLAMYAQQLAETGIKAECRASKLVKQLHLLLAKTCTKAEGRADRIATPGKSSSQTLQGKTKHLPALICSICPSPQCMFDVHLILSYYLKGQYHEIFCFWFFSSISFPPAPQYPIRTVSNFFENSRRYLYHRYQRHRWQICHRCQRHRQQNCHRYQRHRWQIATGINNTGGKFCHHFH